MELTKREREALVKGISAVFGDVSENTDAFFEEMTAQDFADGEVIYENQHTKSALGFVVRGSADVVRARAGCEVYLRTLPSGEAFGAAILFSDSETYVTRVRAKGKTKVVFLPESAAEGLMLAYPRAALGYIAFLSEKIRFLNQKIATFTAGSATEKLENFLRQNADADGVFAPKVSYSRIADALGLGRASLYRAIDDLCAAGIIRKEEKNIILITPKGN